MEKELPKIDLPEEWLVGTGISNSYFVLPEKWKPRSISTK